MKIGYVRVSTQEQNTVRQEKLMETLDVDKVYIDKTSGKNMERPALIEMMGFVREGEIKLAYLIQRIEIENSENSRNKGFRHIERDRKPLFFLQ